VIWVWFLAGFLAASVLFLTYLVWAQWYEGRTTAWRNRWKEER
jgi:hypothetical protein